MINNFKILGQSILQKNGYYAAKDDTVKKFIFLKELALNPSAGKEQIDRAIVIDFDLEVKRYSFMPGKELFSENKEKIFAHKLGAPRGKKKFLSTNALQYLYGKTIKESIEYIAEKREDKKTSTYFADSISSEYDDFLSVLKDQFFMEDKNSIILNPDLLIDDQKYKYYKIREKLEEEKNKKIIISELFDMLVLSMYGSSDRKKLPSIAYITINGEHFLDYQDKKLWKPYINLVYYDLFQRFFNADKIRFGICHVCSEEKNVIGEISLPMKFYGTTNSLFFNALSNSRAFQSFSICEDCLKGTLSGMKYIEHELRDNLFGIPCYLVPELTESVEIFEVMFHSIIRILKDKDATEFSADVEEINKIMKKSSSKDLSFSLLFFDSPTGSQVFEILKLIQHIEYKDLLEKIISMKKLSNKYRLFLFSSDKYSEELRLENLRYYLFPSYLNHPKPDVSLYRKNILDIFAAFIEGRKLNYNNIISRFVDIYRRSYNNSNINSLSPFKMVLFLTVFSQLDQIKGVSIMTEGKSITSIPVDMYREFFSVHSNVYENSTHRQGLFLLGTIINNIVSAQRKKRKQTAAKDNNTEKTKIKPASTFMKKLDFNGIPGRRIPKLVAAAREYSNIYDVYEKSGIWGCMLDRLQGIEKTSMGGEEIVFYILTGISFGSYQARLTNIEKEGE